MLIDGFGFSGYRSFGKEVQKIGPCSKVNLFIGQNNSGKSNILSFLTHHYQQAVSVVRSSANSLTFKEIDHNLGDDTGAITLAFGLSLSGEKYATFIEYCKENHGGLLPSIEKVLRSQTLSDGSDIAWFVYQAAGIERLSGFLPSQDIVQRLKSEGVLSRQEWVTLWSRLTKMERGDLEKHWIPETLQYFSNLFLPQKIEVSLIPAIRRVETGTSKTHDYSGLGIIDRLAKLQDPDYNEQDLRERFEAINGFLKEVTESNDARIGIPYARDKILVHMNGKTLPLEALGTGIHEVIILASAATTLREQVICIEEPELHLHPLLQKKLIRYIQDKTDNQYFITTHSAHLLDTPNASIFHIRLQNGHSVVLPTNNERDKSAICIDLGYRASDLLQTNCIIWVEGPSDRIYLNHWIHSAEPNLVEGLHYSIMFYGGRLLNHLSANDPEIEDFISLRRLNRHIAVVIDSDKPSSHSHINSTKKRIRDEFNQGPGFAWITKGREIENYVESSILEEAVKRVHPKATALEKTGTYENCLKQYRTKAGLLKTGVDKVKVAREVADLPANLDILDLKKMIQKLVHFIQESNDFDVG